ncbi:MAG: YbjN domain-containing protein [Candidatus Fermentibacteria bacterium]|nr:YbjN domain-containing protein [Candidatus Fermentibacteria bacterium]
MKTTIILVLAIATASFAALSTTTVAGYLDQLGANYQEEDGAFWLLAEDSLSGEVFPMFYIEVNASLEACFLAAPTPGLVPESGADRAAAFSKLAELNASYPFVKFEHDISTGEIICTYTFSTENGVGFEAFSAMLQVIFGTVDETAMELAALRQ